MTRAQPKRKNSGKMRKAPRHDPKQEMSNAKNIYWLHLELKILSNRQIIENEVKRAPKKKPLRKGARFTSDPKTRREPWEKPSPG